MSARNLPAGWSSTDNSLEGIAFFAKDSILVIDEFCPQGTATDIQRLHNKADRYLRGVGDGDGRDRMRADGSLRSPRPPRCLVLATGEEIPKGQSLRARLLVLELERGDIGTDNLSICQKEASAGRMQSA